MRRAWLAAILMVPVLMGAAGKKGCKDEPPCRYCMCGKPESQCDKACCAGKKTSATAHERYQCAAKCWHRDKKLEKNPQSW
jgi:hypothetical protein